MKKYFPSYYADFCCLADKCPDSCCAKWEIVIDNETQTKYSLLNDSFGEKIRSFITKNEDDEICFRLKDERCPFLNENGLCDIHIRLGEEYTSRICREHPRFIEEYDGFSEISLSLSCPKASELIFGCELNLNPYPVPDYFGEDEILAELIESRKNLLAFNNDFFLLQAKLLDTAADDQFNLDLYYVVNHPSVNIDFINEYLKLLSEGCEILSDEWENLLIKTIESDVTIEELRDFIVNNNESVSKTCKYYIYRYYLKAINDFDVYSRALFISMSCVISACVAVANSVSFEEAARLYSKEIEHSTDNIDIILDYLCEL